MARRKDDEPRETATENDRAGKGIYATPAEGRRAARELRRDHDRERRRLEGRSTMDVIRDALTGGRR